MTNVQKLGGYCITLCTLSMKPIGLSVLRSRDDVECECVTRGLCKDKENAYGPRDKRDEARIGLSVSAALIEGMVGRDRKMTEKKNL